MGLSQIKVLGASLHGYQSQVNQELQNLKGQAARHVLLLMIMIIILLLYISDSPEIYTAISRKVVGKSARDNPEKYCGWFWVRCSSRKLEKMAQEAMDVCLRELKESNKRSFDSYSVWNSVLIISHITFRDRRVHKFLPTTFLEIAV